MNFPIPASDMHRTYQAEVAAPPAPTYRFPRPGQRPLVFQGSNLAMAMSFTPDFPFWYEINIYRTDEQKFVLVLKMFFQSEEAKDTVRAWSFDNILALFDALEAYDAAEDIRVSFDMSNRTCPAELAAMAYELRAKAASYRSHWASLIGELFEELDAVGQAFA
jgi:hypothetical protein